MNRNLLLILAASVSGVLYAQTNPLITESKQSYTGVKNNLLKAADKITERDRHRWELDPASAEDYTDRD